MARILMIDGPEGAGKSTLIKSLTNQLFVRNIPYRVFHWSTPGPGFHSHVYLKPLRDVILDVPYNPVFNSYDSSYKQELASEDRRPPKVLVWDRGWPSEYVYPRLMPRMRSSKRIFWDDAWAAEWYLGRALQSWGTRVMILGPDADRLKEVRGERTGDETVNKDHPVEPALERALYQRYGERFDYLVYRNKHDLVHDEIISNAVVTKIQDDLFHQSPLFMPPGYCGPVNAPVVFLGESLSKTKDQKAWLPFTSAYTTRFGRQFGDAALKCGWTNTDHLRQFYDSNLSCCPSDTSRILFDELIEERFIVACGRVAERFCRDFRVPNWIRIEHPASGFRWGQKIEAYVRQLRTLELEVRRRVYAEN